uniref:Uncharacterized protein n=1 Tax=Oncorhynchus kisutch TaxID=8019 RepID=A0A8C7F1U0_ONCKI
MHFPRVAFSTKLKVLPVAPFTDRRREGKRKGNGKKRNHCQRKYKDYCIHGPSCINPPKNELLVSFLYLTVMTIVMAIRYHKQGEYNFDNEEKVKLKADAHP